MADSNSLYTAVRPMVYYCISDISEGWFVLGKAKFRHKDGCEPGGGTFPTSLLHTHLVCSWQLRLYL